MSLSEKEKMLVLLEQINLPKEIADTYFQHSRIKKLTVYREEKRWHFVFQLERLLPITVYRTFLDHLRETFQHIATIETTIEPDDDHCDNELVTQYWSYFVSELENILPTQRETLQHPKEINEHTLIFHVKTEAEQASLKKNIIPLFSQFKERVGLRHYTLSFDVHTEQKEI